jgi:exopolyphosphatase/guanosine-5'-triphosphate,3'-diphosphate pyrophosphatase
VGVLDIGSNSIRLVVFEDAGRVPLPIFNEKVLCGLGSEINITGNLSVKGSVSAVANIERFIELVSKMDLAHFQIIATAAVRDAKNGMDFVNNLERKFHIPIKILTGQLEAELSALGVVSAFPKLNGVVGDLGGGSLELVNVIQGQIKGQVSLPLGTLRLDHPSSLNGKEITKIISNELSHVPWLKQLKGRSIYAVGGAWRNLARLHMYSVNYPLHIIHGYKILDQAAAPFLKKILKSSSGELGEMKGVSKKRINETSISALILERILNLGKGSDIIFSAFGLREGCLFDRLPFAEKEKDPLIISCTKVAGALSRVTMDPTELENWLMQFFMELGAPDKRLLKAICVLRDCAWMDHPSYRGEQAFLRVLRLPAVGLTHEERVFMGLVVLARYNGNLRIPVIKEWSGFISRQRMDLALKVGLVIRLGITLCAGLAGVLENIKINKSSNRIVIFHPSEMESVKGYAVARRMEHISKLFRCFVILEPY